MNSPHSSPASTRAPALTPALRVPAVTAVFWIVKVLTTGVGETTSDFLVKTYSPVLMVLLAGVIFAACFFIQIRAHRYVPWRYWLFVTAVAVFGTMVADVTHIVLAVPYAVSTPAFAVVLAAVFWLWRRTEGDLSVHSIFTQRRELFYWAAVLATFALGTALGDLTAVTFHLGYLGSGIMFAVLFAAPGIGYRLGLPATLSFWAAYVVTRPLGASFADWVAVEHSRGGLAWGTRLVSAVGLLVIAACVAGLQIAWSRAGTGASLVAADAGINTAG
jgi:uncharacterized membrane-anchored protein